MNTRDVIVIGAGWAGLSAAERLLRAGLRVLVIDKSRGPGGRSSTRRQEGFEFDHGAQYFTARRARFREAVEGWKARGLIAPWTPRLKVFGSRPESAGTPPEERLVGVPGMNSVLSTLARGLDCRFTTRVETLHRDERWRVVLEEGETLQAHALVLTAPPAQSADLLGESHRFHRSLLEVSMSPTWALMLGYDRVFDPGFDAAFDNEGPLTWMACNGTKPGRSGWSWVAHAGMEWSRRHLERDPEWVAARLGSALAARLGDSVPGPAFSRAHRWRYAQCTSTLDLGCLWAPEERLAVAGDWCAGNRIEGAWTSGQAAAERILESR
jgi:predicted NAD/FAD-dependent oxidoreductase